MNVRNKTLNEKTERFIIASIELLREFASKEVLPVTLESLYEEEKRPDFSLFIFKHSDDLDKLAEFVDCAKYILRNPTTRKATEWKTKNGTPVKDLPIKVTYFRILYVLLAQYLRAVGGFSFAKNRFDDLYLEFEKYVYASKALCRISTLLKGLLGNIGEVNFGSGTKMRRISETEKSTYERQALGPIPIPIGHFDFLSTDYVLETVYSRQKGPRTDTSIHTRKFEGIITALRLFKRGRVGFDVIKEETITWDPIGVTVYSGSSYRQGLVFPGSYKLDVSEKPELLRLWRKFKNFRRTWGSSRSNGYINLALKRFNFGMEESNHESRIIDFFVAFEALYLPESGELSYRLSNRIAIMLGRNPEEAEKIRRFMTKAYEARSKIIHGKKIKAVTVEGENVKLADFVRKVEQYLRESLIAFITLSKKYRKQDSIIALLDKGLINPKTRKLLTT